MTKFNFGIHGCMGRMGRSISKLSKEYSNLNFTCGIEHSKHLDIGKEYPEFSDVFVQDIDMITKKIDGMIDFSSVDGLNQILNFCLQNKIALVIGTTGYSPEILTKIKKASQTISILVASNMSLGVNIFFSLIEKASSMLQQYKFDPEIIEAHHKHKVDAPSGTANTIKDIILKEYHWDVKNTIYGRQGIIGKRKEKELGIHSIRGGSIVGDHTASFIGELEKIEISHQAYSRDVFAKGALEALFFVLNKQPGLYSMKDVLGLT